MEQIYTLQGDTVDLIADRYFGSTDMVGEILKANPGLARLGPILPLGTPINLPPARLVSVAPTVSLW